jgi:hypothetical protein
VFQVIWSSIAFALLTDVALIAVIVLNSRIRPSAGRPVLVFFHESFSDDEDEQEQMKLWREVLIDFILTAADYMAIQGFALLASAYLNTFTTAKRNHLSALNYQDNYFTCLVYLCIIACTTHLASLLAIRSHLQDNLTSSKIRICIFVVFGLCLGVTLDLNEYAFQYFYVHAERFFISKLHWSAGLEKWAIEYAAPMGFIVWVYWIAIYHVLQATFDQLGAKILRILRRSAFLRELKQNILCCGCWSRRNQARTESDSHKEAVAARWLKTLARWIFLSHPMVIFVVQLIFTAISIVFLLKQKYAKAPTPSAAERAQGVGQWCSLWNSNDNSMSFGQFLPLFLLMLPVYSSVGKYFGKDLTLCPRVPHC